MANTVIKKDDQTTKNVNVCDIYINDRYYTSIIGIKFGNNINYHMQYKFIHDILNELIKTDEYPDRMVSALEQEVRDMNESELSDLLYWEV